MMVTRAEAEHVIQATKCKNAEIRSAVLSRRVVHQILADAEQLEPSERLRVVIELATALWLKSLAPKEPLYPGFEAFLRASFAGRSDFEQHARPLIGTGEIYSDAAEMYGDYLRSMFVASGRTRSQFYGEMLAELGLQTSMDDVDFGERAEAFFEKVVGTLHEEHLLVFYCVKLVSKLYMQVRPGNGTPMSDEELEMAYKYFEGDLPISENFLYYTEDSTFLSHSLKQGDLSKIK